MKFPDLLNKLSIPYITEGHHHCRSDWVQLDCPFCGKDSNRYHLGYSLRNNYLNCWQCGYHSIFSVIRELTTLSDFEIKNLIKDIETVKIPKKQEKTRKLILPLNRGLLLKPHIQYLENRGFNAKKLIELWDISGIGISLELTWRIFIPIHHHGKIVSWTTRSISNTVKRRYISAKPSQESMSHKTLLYGEDYIRSSTIIIVEGPLDVWRIGPGAVAIFGLNYTKKQLMKMTKYHTRYICLDNEDTAQKVAKRLCDDLSIFNGNTYNIQLDSKDAGEATSREIKKVRKLLK